MAELELQASARPDFEVPEEPGRLIGVECGNRDVDIEHVSNLLRQDFVVLVRNVPAEYADILIYDLAKGFGLSENLQLQAGFAAFQGHRENVGKYFMSVNKRKEYQFIPPHSEGNSFVNMQLAAFFCYKNSTDGGETILINVNESSKTWESLREQKIRAKPSPKQFTPNEIARARALHRVRLPDDVLRDDDQVLRELPSKIPGLTLLEVLAKPQKIYSRLLNQDVHVYWDSVASIDHSSVRAYTRLLKQSGLLREPLAGLDLSKMDNAADRRIWDSKVDHTQLFKCKITRKLEPGDFIIQNNLTWTHSTANWTPNSGVRNVVAAFA